MFCRQLILSAAKKRFFHVGVKASNIACGYVKKFNDPNHLGDIINYNEIRNRRHNLEIIKRFKHDKKRVKHEKNEESDDEDDDEDDDDVPQDKSSPVISVKVNSLRTDLVLKAGLNIARNKVETAFYESKIRVNGRKIFKKSEQLQIGDEVDLIRGPSPTNPNFLVVSRIHILNAKENAENISIKFTRNKALVIENYDDPWKVASNQLA